MAASCPSCCASSRRRPHRISRPSVAIIGGGIGGLFAANALVARGLRVAVYEQATAIREIGAGVFVTPNAVRHLESVGLGREVERWGARVAVWHGLYAPKGTPKPVLDKLVAALQAALKDPALIARFADLGTDPVALAQANPQPLRTHLKAEIDKWAPLIKKAGVYAD